MNKLRRKEMKYNRRAIFGRMWELVREEKMEKKAALRTAWDEVKNPQGLAAMAKAFKERKVLIDRLEEENKALRESIISAMNGEEKVVADMFKISYITVEKTVLDQKKLKEEQSELYAAYLAKRKERRFQVI